MSLFDDIRAKYPDYSDDEVLRGLQATKYPDYSVDEIAKATGYGSNNDGQYMSGLKRSFQELPGLAAGVGAYAADAIGATDARDSLLSYANKRNETVSRGHQNDASSITDAWDGKTSWMDFLANSAGYVTGQALQSLGTGGLGVIGAKMLAKNGVKQAGEIAAARAIASGATEAVAKEAATAAVKAAATRAVNVGAVSGAYGHNFGMELGSIYPDAVDQAKLEGRDELDAGDMFRVLGAASVAAGVDTAGEAIMASRIFRGSKAGGQGILGRAAREVPAGMVREGATEAVQTAIEHYGAGTPIADEAGMRDIIDSAGIGAVGGILGGGMAARTRRPSEPEKEPTPPVANIEDIATAPSIDEAIIAADKAVRGEPTRGERVANIKSELSDRAIVGDLRAKYGDDGFSQLLTSLNQANDPRTPEATREKHLQAVETALFNLRASVDQPAQTALLEGQQAMPMLTGPDGLPLLGDVSTPTGTMRAGPDGVAVPETAADLTETMRARDERTSLGEQQGQMPDDVIPMGMRQEQPAWTNPRSKTPEPTIIDALNVPNAVNAYVDKQRAINTPMAHAFVQAFDSGKITPADVAKLIVPAQQETPSDRIAAAAATAPQTLQQRLEAFRRAPDATTIETPVVASRPRPKGAPDAIGGAGTVQDMAQGQPEQAGQPAAAPAPGSADALPVGVQSEPDAALTPQGPEAGSLATETDAETKPPARNATALLADLTARNEPVPPALRVQSRKESDGRYGLYFTGTNNEVWKGERFKSPKEARSTLEAVRAVGMPTAAPVIPRSFRRSQKVTTQVFDEASGKMQPAELDADTALRALNEDISALEAFLKCIG